MSQNFANGLVFGLSVSFLGSLPVKLDMFIAPGEIGTFSGFSTISSTIGVTVNFSEDI